MTTSPTRKFTNLSRGQYRKKKLIQHTNSLKPIQMDREISETILSPNDELECRQIYEKLEQLQPNGVCVNLNTLRRALYPPISISKDKNDQILLLRRFYRQRTDEIPRTQIYDIPKQTKVKKINYMNLDQVINQANKHAIINYSYYTRTK